MANSCVGSRIVTAYTLLSLFLCSFTATLSPPYKTDCELACNTTGVTLITQKFTTFRIFTLSTTTNPSLNAQSFKLQDSTLLSSIVILLWSISGNSNDKLGIQLWLTNEFGVRTQFIQEVLSPGFITNNLLPVNNPVAVRFEFPRLPILSPNLDYFFSIRLVSAINSRAQYFLLTSNTIYLDGSRQYSSDGKNWIFETNDNINFNVNTLTNTCDCIDQPGTCFDGQQNGDEVGVDCGGRCGVDCPGLSTCFDNLQNGDEEGIDCGGSCTKCDTTSSNDSSNNSSSNNNFESEAKK